MIDPAEYRDRFPILATCTYLINHSLAAMPAAAEDNLREYARIWRERGIRAWAEGWWEMPVTVGDQLGRILGAPPGSIVMHQNVTVAEAIVLSCFAARQRAEPDRLRGGELPVGALPLPGAAGARGRSRSRTARRSSTRSTSGRCSSRSATSCSRTARSRTSSRSSVARTRPARTWCSTATSPPASCRST